MKFLFHSPFAELYRKLLLQAGGLLLAGIQYLWESHGLRSDMASELRSHVAMGSEIKQTNTAGPDRVNSNKPWKSGITGTMMWKNR
jgi:hypothetical protein